MIKQERPLIGSLKPEFRVRNLDKRGLRTALRLYFVMIPVVGIVSSFIVIGSFEYSQSLIVRYNVFDDIPAAILICLLGLFISSASFFWTTRNVVIARFERHGPPRRSLWGAWILLALSVSWVISGGGSLAKLKYNIPALLSKVRGGIEGESYLYLLLSLMMLISIVLAIKIMTSKPSCISLARVAIVLIITATVCFLAGSRARAIGTVLAPIIFMLGRPRPRWLWMLPVLFAAFVVFGYGNQLRRESQGVQGPSWESPLVLAISSFSILDETAVAVDVSNRLSRSWIESAWTIVAWTLPKEVVGQKRPIASIVARMLLAGDTLGGITLGAYGETYYYFGITGLVIFSGLIGGFIGMIFKRIDLSFAGLSAYVGVFYYVFISIRNGFFQDILFFSVVIFILSCDKILVVLRSRGERLARGADKPSRL